MELLELLADGVRDNPSDYHRPSECYDDQEQQVEEDFLECHRELKCLRELSSSRDTAHRTSVV